tara:strand:+ start:1526 stop:2086 length:561 start_codon:yes stop_codon:yes gene_type:complete
MGLLRQKNNPSNNYMDISQNTHVDLLYLTNPYFIDKYNKTNPEKSGISQEDIKFYRKRILETTKNYLRGKKLTSEIDGAFENYAQLLIEHYKFIDKKDLVQKEYSDIKEKKKKPRKNFKLMENDTLIMKTKENTVKTIKDYLPIVVKEKKKKKMVIPKQKKYDIKNPDLRVKGVKQKKNKNKNKKN